MNGESACPQCGYGNTHSHWTDSIKASPSYVRSLIASNEPPPHSIIVDLEHCLGDVELLILDTDEEITRLRARIEFLSKKRSEAVGYATAYRKVLHPMRRIPTELWCEVFFCCADPIDPGMLIRHPPNDTFAMTSAPWLLTRVSHHWREVMLSSPNLWTIVSFNSRKLDIDIATPWRKHNLTSVLSYYLRLSQDLPLAVAIIYYELAYTPLFLVFTLRAGLPPTYA